MNERNNGLKDILQALRQAYFELEDTGAIWETFRGSGKQRELSDVAR